MSSHLAHAAGLWRWLLHCGRLAAAGLSLVASGASGQSYVYDWIKSVSGQSSCSSTVLEVTTTPQAGLAGTFQAGDLLIGFLAMRSGYAPITPPGWTLLGHLDSGPGSVMQAVFSKVSTAADLSATHTFGYGCGNVNVYAYRNARDPVVHGWTTASGATPQMGRAPGATPPGTPRLFMASVAIADQVMWKNGAISVLGCGSAGCPVWGGGPQMTTETCQFVGRLGCPATTPTAIRARVARMSTPWNSTAFIGDLSYGEAATSTQPRQGVMISIAPATIYTNLSVAITNGQPSYQRGQQTVYTVDVSNTGAPVSGIAPNIALDAKLSGATWTCSQTAGTGGTCSAASGSGTAWPTLGFTNGSPATMRIVITAAVSSSASGPLATSASVPLSGTGWADSSTNDNGPVSDSDSLSASGPSFGVGVSSTSPTFCGATSGTTDITLTARDGGGGAGNALTRYAGTIRVSASGGVGSFSLVTGAGSLSNVVAGRADYTFNGASNADAGVVTLRLSHGAVVDQTVSVAEITPVYAPQATGGPSPSIGWRTGGTNTFSVNAADASLPGNVIVAGRAHAMRVTFNSTCGGVSGYAGARTLKAFLSLGANHPAGAGLPGINGAATGLSSSAGSPTLVNVTFAAGAATFTLTPPADNPASGDVGQYMLTLLDDSGTFGSSSVSGQSALLTARPFGLYVPNSGMVNGTNWSNNSRDTTGSGGVFGVAGEAFNVRAVAVSWQSADDANNDGVPDAGANLADNAVTPRFSAVPEFYEGDTFHPADGTKGTVGGFASSCSAGVCDRQIRFYEVGSFTLRARASNYLGSGATVPDNGGFLVGRFRPSHLVLELADGPVFQGYCGAGGAGARPGFPAGGFTYAGQRIVYQSAPRIAVRAVDAYSGATVNNYRGAWFRLQPQHVVAARAYSGNGGLAFAPPASAEVSVDATNRRITFSLGNAAAGEGLVFQRSGTPATPFEAQISLTLSNLQDADGVGTQNNASYIAFANQSGFQPVGSNLILHGYLGFSAAAFQQQAMLVPLVATVELRYWGAAGAYQPLNDPCINEPGQQMMRANIVLENYRGNLNACETRVNETVLSFNGLGVASFSMQNPGAANRGMVGLRLNLDGSQGGSYCNAVGGGADASSPAAKAFLVRDAMADLKATAAFGGVAPDASTRRMYLRENY